MVGSLECQTGKLKQVQDFSEVVVIKKLRGNLLRVGGLWRGISAAMDEL